MSSTAVEIPGYVAGTYTIDPGHSDVAFTVRHLMVSKVRGHFTRFQGELTLAPDPLASSVTASIELASIDTNNPQRDDDLRSATRPPGGNFRWRASSAAFRSIWRMLRWSVSCATCTGPRAEPFLHGSRLALRTHTERILQLGQEYPSRFPDWTRTDSLPARKGLPGRGGPTARAVTRDQAH
jgi:hypothetical protein